MASADRKHQKRLKEAERQLIKMNKLRVQGKITKEEFARALRPYKDELVELGYPIKTKDRSGQEEEKPERREAVVVGSVRRPEVKAEHYRKRSTLSIEEIEHSIDRLSSEQDRGGRLNRLYAERYGEELPPPEDKIDMTLSTDGDSDYDRPAPGLEDETSTSEDQEQKKPFWKNIFSKREGTENKGEQ